MNGWLIFALGALAGGFIAFVILAVIMYTSEPDEETEISCRCCRHCADGKPDDRNKNCALCITRGAWSGFERMIDDG